jgi:methionine biosynthesis protein MetW
MATVPETTFEPLAASLFGREDYAVISEFIPKGASVLDVGCGEGELLAWLVENKSVEGRGVEISSQKVHKAISRGLSVYQGNIEEGLAAYPDNAFDYIILSQTLQETHQPDRVMQEMLRIGSRLVVTFPNFGHWAVRFSLLTQGRAPRTKLLPFEWYNTPNIRVLSIKDFEGFIAGQKWRIEKELFLSGNRRIRYLPNLRAEVAICLVTR